MGKIHVAALAAPLNETRRFKIANEVPDLPWHLDINATAMPENLVRYAQGISGMSKKTDDFAKI
jgi:hypothetical protein